jgi:hypothetical protein
VQVAQRCCRSAAAGTIRLSFNCSTKTSREEAPRSAGHQTAQARPGPTLARSGRERQEAYRTKLKAEGRKALHLWLQPEVIEQFDALRTDNATGRRSCPALINQWHLHNKADDTRREERTRHENDIEQHQTRGG